MGNKLWCSSDFSIVVWENQLESGGCEKSKYKQMESTTKSVIGLKISQFSYQMNISQTNLMKLETRHIYSAYSYI